jgi:hypothetical protein
VLLATVGGRTLTHAPLGPTPASSAYVAELVAMVARKLEEFTAVPEQLEPERARSCRNAITMAPVMIDEIRLRAHTRPLDEPEPLGGCLVVSMPVTGPVGLSWFRVATTRDGPPIRGTIRGASRLALGG